MNHSTRNIIIAFIASPGDVADERRVASEVVDELNDSLRAINWQIDLLGWEDTLPGAARPQELINRDVDACHLFIGVLWRRWGQPTGEFSSGFEEEFERVRKRRKDANPPEIWLSFKQVDPELLKDPGEQLKRVVAFRQSQIELREVLFKEFTDVEDWRAKLRNWLLQYVLIQANQSQQAVETEENVSAPQQSTADKPNLSTLTQDSAKRLAYVQLGEIINALSSMFANTTNDSQTGSVIDLAKAARLHLLSTSLTSSLYTHEVLSSHLINYLYVKKEQLEATDMERDLLFRTIVSDQIHVMPGWYWFRNLEQEEIESVLFQTAVLDNEAEIRRQALYILKNARIKATTQQAKEFIRHSLNDKEDSVRLSSLHYFGSYGDAEDLTEIGPLLTNENSLVRDGAQLARFRILARHNINQAFAELVKSDLHINLIEAFNELGIITEGIENESLTNALRHSNFSIRLFALKELSRRGGISKDTLNQLKTDSSKVVKEAAYAELVKQGEEVDLDQLIEALPDERNIWSHFYESSYPLIEPSPTFLAFYRKFTIDELLSRLDHYSTRTPLILKALAKYHFNEISDVIRRNLVDDFESLRSESVKRLRARYGESADEVIEAFKDTERFIKDGLISVALASLADSGEPADVDLARKYLNSSEKNIRFEAIRIIERFGDASDVEPLLNIYRNSHGNLQKVAINAAINLAPGINGAARELLQSDDSTLVAVAIKVIWNEDKTTVAPLLEPLLHHDKAEIRTIILGYIIEKYSKEELEQLLQKYLGEATYYYNVVCWIDRALYAPNGIRNMFIRQIKSHIT